jgi:hypothetical protein
MASKKSKAWKNTLNIIYGVGAAIVILGALFKLEHYPGVSISSASWPRTWEFQPSTVTFP